MFQPYDYQEECCEAVAKARREGQKRALVVMASGLGKTVTAALDAKRWLEEHGGRLLYLCHQNNILEQARTTFEFILGTHYRFGYFHGEEKSRQSVTCLFASFQTMRGWRERFLPTDFDYIVVDESHHGAARTYRPTLEYFRPKFLLGITATPERSDLQDIRKIYGEEVFSLHLDDALARGLLTPVDYRLLTDAIQREEVFDTAVGRLDIGFLNKTLFIPRRDEEIVKIIQDRMAEIKQPRVMIFCPSISHCERLVVFLPHAFPIHSRLSHREQRTRLDAFRRGLVDTVLTVDKFNEGIDVPEANVIVFLRSTASRMLFFQQLGRGLRRVPGKDRALVLDFVGNCERLETVSALWRSTSEKRGAHEHAEERTPFSVDIGRVEFTEVAKRILEVITIIRSGYTKELLVRQLQGLATQLGRRPWQRDVQTAYEAGLCAPYRKFKEVFGSFGAALRAANLPYRSPGSSPEICSRELRDLAIALGRIPTPKDIADASRAEKCVGIQTLKKVFGVDSFAGVLEAAGLITIRRTPYTKDELIGQLVRLAREKGGVITKRDLVAGNRAGKCVDYDTFRNVLGKASFVLNSLTGHREKRVHFNAQWFVRRFSA